MNAVGIADLLVVFAIVLVWTVPIAAFVWALTTLQRLKIGQEALKVKLDAIERALQQRQ